MNVSRMSFLALLPLSLIAMAAQGADDGAKEGVKKIVCKSTERTCATGVDFRSQYGLAFDSLTSLGARIEQARGKADPVGLASAAEELAVAEKVSDKKAPITADELRKEAVEMAKQRDMSQELTAVGLIVGGDAAAELNKQAKAAKTQEDETAEAVKNGERPKGIFSTLEVCNQSEVCVDVYANSRYIGHVEAYQHTHFHVHLHGHVTLVATGPGHYWHQHVHGDFNTYEFELED